MKYKVERIDFIDIVPPSRDLVESGPQSRNYNNYTQITSTLRRKRSQSLADIQMSLSNQGLDSLQRAMEL